MIFTEKEINLLKIWYDRSVSQHWGKITAQIPEEEILLGKINSKTPINNSLITQRILRNWMDKSTNTSEELSLKHKLSIFF